MQAKGRSDGACVNVCGSIEVSMEPTRRDILMFGLSSMAAARLARRGFAQVLSGAISERGVSRPAAASGQRRIDLSSIARKPEFSVIAAAADPSRRLHNASIVEGNDGVLIAAWSARRCRIAGANVR